MYQIRIEEHAQAVRLIPAATKPEASQLLVSWITNWVKGGEGRTAKEPSVDADTDTITVHLIQNGETVGIASAYEKPSDMHRALTGKFKAYKLFVSKIPATHFAEQVGEVISEVLAGKWTRDTMMAPGILVGDLLDIPGFYQDARIVQQITSAYVGRLLRMAAINQFKIDLEDPEQFMKTLPVLEATMVRENVATAQVVRDITKKHGKVELDQAKVQALLKQVSDEVADTIENIAKRYQ